MDLQIDGNAALVTASSSGLGKASAKALAREGADVVINGRDEERLADAKAEVEAVATGEVAAHSADLTDPDAIAALVEATVDEFGTIDHLVTSAGGPPSGSFLDTDDEEWQQAFDLLVMSVVWTLREAHPHLVESDAGSVVAITSRSVQEVIDGLVLSNAVRRTVIGLVKTVSREFAPDVRANAVLPGAHETSRIENLIETAVERGEYETYEAGYEDWAADIPLDRVGEPQELGDVVAFLASPRASYVTGTTLTVDGGSSRSV
jgi:3-oxoacyl-[acyl-carrier protein] reductase